MHLEHVGVLVHRVPASARRPGQGDGTGRAKHRQRGAQAVKEAGTLRGSRASNGRGLRRGVCRSFGFARRASSQKTRFGHAGSPHLIRG